MEVLILRKIITGGEWKFLRESDYLTLNNDWGSVYLTLNNNWGVQISGECIYYVTPV